MVTIGLTIAAVAAVGAIGAGLFIESGFYNIGADDHHTEDCVGHHRAIARAL
ncbi:MAG: hypothetical protein M3O41_04115 [Pseudomonadota bacterium]|nr:hypothetical protein [Pseudomonadota bacterium]